MKSKTLESVLVKLASEDPKIREQLVTALKKEALGDEGRLSLDGTWNISWKPDYGGVRVSLVGWGVNEEFGANIKKGETTDEAVLRATSEKLNELWQKLYADYTKSEKSIKNSLKILQRHQR